MRYQQVVMRPKGRMTKLKVRSSMQKGCDALLESTESHQATYQADRVTSINIREQ